jgi:hypothetical protein
MEEGVDYKDRELHVQTHTRRQEVEGETSDTVVEINYRDDGKLHTMERCVGMYMYCEVYCCGSWCIVHDVWCGVVWCKLRMV